MHRYGRDRSPPRAAVDYVSCIIKRKLYLLNMIRLTQNFPIISIYLRILLSLRHLNPDVFVHDTAECTCTQSHSSFTLPRAFLNSEILQKNVTTIPYSATNQNPTSYPRSSRCNNPNLVHITSLQQQQQQQQQQQLSSPVHKYPHTHPEPHTHSRAYLSFKRPLSSPLYSVEPLSLSLFRVIVVGIERKRARTAAVALALRGDVAVSLQRR